MPENTLCAIFGGTVFQRSSFVPRPNFLTFESDENAFINIYPACKATTSEQHKNPFPFRKTVSNFPSPENQHLAKCTRKGVGSVNPAAVPQELLPFLGTSCKICGVALLGQCLFLVNIECNTKRSSSEELRRQLFLLARLNLRDLTLLGSRREDDLEVRKELLFLLEINNR